MNSMDPVCKGTKSLELSLFRVRRSLIFSTKEDIT